MRKIIFNQNKKRIRGSAIVLIITALLLTLSITVFVFGSDLSEMIRVYRNNVILEVNNTRISADNFLYNGTTYVPIRVVAQILGKQVDWNSTTRVASIKDATYVKPQIQTNMNLTLYFPDSNAGKVWPEIRNVMVYNDGTARAAVEALISGPISEGQSPSIPPGTILKDINILNGICTVDFSKEFIDNHWGGSAGEMTTLASIINTLTEFPSIQKVMILIEGKAGATLGNILFDHALERMSDMIGQ